MGTVIVFIILMAVVGGIVYSLYRNKKSHKGGCGGDCASCGHACGQHMP